MPTTKQTDAHLSDDLIKPLIEKGLVPAQARRVIIDFQQGQAVKIFYECIADTPTIEAVMGIDFGTHEADIR